MKPKRQRRVGQNQARTSAKVWVDWVVRKRGIPTCSNRLETSQPEHWQPQTRGISTTASSIRLGAVPSLLATYLVKKVAADCLCHINEPGLNLLSNEMESGE